MDNKVIVSIEDCNKYLLAKSRRIFYNYFMYLWYRNIYRYYVRRYNSIKENNIYYKVFLNINIFYFDKYNLKYNIKYYRNNYCLFIIDILFYRKRVLLSNNIVKKKRKYKRKATGMYTLDNYFKKTKYE